MMGRRISLHKGGEHYSRFVRAGLLALALCAVAACSGGGGGAPGGGTGGGAPQGGLEGGNPGGDDRSGFQDYSGATGVTTSTGEVWKVEIVHSLPGGDPGVTDGAAATDLGVAK